MPEQSFDRAPRPERRANNVFHHYYYYSRGSKSSKGKSTKHYTAGKSTKHYKAGKSTKSSKAGKSTKSSKVGKSSKSSKPGKGTRWQWPRPRPPTPRPTPPPPTRPPTSGPPIPQVQNEMGIGCLNEVRLENGATLSANITTLLGGKTFFTSDNFRINGVTSIRQGTAQGAQNRWTYVIDVSGSTASSCGNPREEYPRL